MFLYGQTTQHAQHIATGSFKTNDVYFYPDAITAIFGIPANELANQRVDITFITGIALNEKLLNAPNYIPALPASSVP